MHFQIACEGLSGVKLIDPRGGFQSRLFGEVEAETDEVCSGNEIVTLSHEPPDYINTISNLSFPMSKFDVMRPSNFHKVLKNSVHV